jgi:hypothetical protein
MVGVIHEAVSAKAEASPTQPGGFLPDYARQDITPTIIFVLNPFPNYFFFALAFSALAAFFAASAAAKAFCLASWRSSSSLSR